MSPQARPLSNLVVWRAWHCWCALALLLLVCGCERTLEKRSTDDSLPPPTPEQRAELEQLRRAGVAELEQRVDRELLTAALAAADYDTLEEALGSLLEQYGAGEVSETTFRHAARVFRDPDPELDAPLDRWVEKRPEAWAAHLSRGAHRVAMGHAAEHEPVGPDAQEAGQEVGQDAGQEAGFEKMRGHFEAAETDLLRAIELEPRVLVPYSELLSMYRALGRGDQCERWLDAALEQNPAAYHPRARYQDCVRPSWGGSHAEMRAAARRARAHADENPLLILLAGHEYHDRARVAWKQKRFDAALQLLDRALEYGPAAFLYRDRGRVHALAGQPEAALRDFTSALVYQPDCVECLRRRAALHLERGRLGAAIGDLDRAIAVAADDARLFRERGYAREVLGHWVGAVADFERAAELEPEHAYAFRKLGWIQMRNLHEPERAQAAYQRLTELAPDDADAWLSRAAAESMTEGTDFFASLESYLELADRGDPAQRDTIRQAEQVLAGR